MIAKSKKLWAKIRYYIFASLTLVIAIAVFVMSRGKKVDPWKILSKQKKSHEEELKLIDAAHERLKKEKAEIDENLRKTLKEIEEKYAEKNKTLDKKTKSEIEKIVKDTDLNSEELAKKLADVTGLSLED